MKKRKTIPAELKDKLLVECGYKCSIPMCDVSQSLEFHHIDSDPSNNTKKNIIVLCAVHHHQADLKKITKRSLKLIKGLLLDIDGTLTSPKSCEEINLSKIELKEFLDIARDIKKASLRVLSREFIRSMLGFDNGYRCRTGLDFNDFLMKHNLVVEEEKTGPSFYKISEKGKLLCKFLFTSQYDFPQAIYERTVLADDIKDILDWSTKAKAFECFGKVVKKRDDNKTNG